MSLVGPGRAKKLAVFPCEGLVGLDDLSGCVLRFCVAHGASWTGFYRSERRLGRIGVQIEADERLCRAHRCDQVRRLRALTDVSLFKAKTVVPA